MVKSGDFLAKLPANSKPKPVFFFSHLFSHKKTKTNLFLKQVIYQAAQRLPQVGESVVP
jgi:hypothetical protein